jgi:hypothetical protein
MKIRHRKHPFYHTLIEDYANEDELQMLTKEINGYSKLQMRAVQMRMGGRLDPHHEQLLLENKSEAYCADDIFEGNRSKSYVLEFGRKIFHLGLEKYVKQNPLLGFIPLTTEDIIYIQRYRNGSHYYTHNDTSLLTAVHLIYVQDFKGGELHFPDHNYTPPLKHNKCIIFSGYENHRVNEIKSDYEGYIRYSINQRLYLAKE